MNVEWVREIFSTMYSCVHRGFHYLALSLFLMCSTSLSAAPDITIVKAVDGRSTEPATVGQVVTYTLIISNSNATGTDPAQSVIFTDILPNGVTFITDSVTINGGLPVIGANPNLGIPLSDIAPGADVKITFQAILSYPVLPPLTEPLLVKNRSSVAYNYVGHPGSLTLISNEVAGVLPLLPLETPNVKVVKSFSGNSNVTLGETKTFEVTITPTANVPFSQLNFQDLLVPGLVYFPLGGVTIAQPDQPDVIVYVDPNEEFTIFSIPDNIRSSFGSAFDIDHPITVRFQVNVTEFSPFNGASLYNRAIVSSLRPLGLWQNSVSNETLLTIQPIPEGASFLTVLKQLSTVNVIDGVQATVNPGNVVTYNIQIANVGDTASEGESISFSDTIAAGSSYISGSLTVDGTSKTPITIYPNLTFSLPLIPPIPPIPPAGFAGNPVNISFQVRVHEPIDPSITQIKNIATVTYIEGEQTINALSNPTLLIPAVPAPALTVAKNVLYPEGQVSAAIGDTVIFTVFVENTGTAIATTPWFVDPLPSSLQFIPGTVSVTGISAPIAATYDPEDGFFLSSIAPAEIITINFSALVTGYPPTGTVTNTADVSYCVDTGEGCIPTVANGSVPVVIDPLAASTLVLQKSVSYTPPATLGDHPAFTVVITNVGAGSAVTPWFVDPLPSGLIYEAGSSLISLNGGLFSPAGDPSTGFSLPSLNPGDVVTVTFRTVLVSLPAEGSSYTNVAEVIYCTDDLQGGCETVSRFSPAVIIVVDLPAPVGQLNTCHLVHRTLRTLTITWDIPFANVQTYRIFFEGKLIAEVAGGEPLFYRTRVRDSLAVNQYSVQAIYVGGNQTPVTPVRIE